MSDFLKSENSMAPSIAAATICNANYYWGGFLLAASMAQCIPHISLTVFAPDSEDARFDYLRQFENVEVRGLSTENPRHLCTRKAEALLQLDAEYLVWFDADCMMIGDVSPLLIPSNGQWQMRVRSPEENASCFVRRHFNHYAAGEPLGGVPQKVLEAWREDVGQKETPRNVAMVVSNVFVVHRRHRPFLQMWKNQVEKVLPPKFLPQPIVDSVGYYLSDESVLSSLFNFAHEVPEIGDYVLGSEPERHVAHFIGGPKPWEGWQPTLFYYYPFIRNLLEWCRSEQYEAPPLPLSFDSRFYWCSQAQVSLRRFWGQSKGLARKVLLRR